jgi:thiol-disulfide isomerase/thioredoxin
MVFWYFDSLKTIRNILNISHLSCHRVFRRHYSVRLSCNTMSGTLVGSDNARVGLRVVRGRDWIFGERDGGDGNSGTIDRFVPNSNNERVFVKFDFCGEVNCRIGAGGKHDLFVSGCQDDGPSATAEKEADPNDPFVAETRNLWEDQQKPRASTTARPPTQPPTRSAAQQGGTRQQQQSPEANEDGVSWQTAIMMMIGAVYLSRSFSGSSHAEADLSDAVPIADLGFLEGKIREVRTYDEFKGILAHHKDDTGLPVIVDFYSQSCGPCHMIAPAYKRIAKEYQGKAVFVKVDVNRNHETSSACRVYSMPTFQFYLGGKMKQVWFLSLSLSLSLSRIYSSPLSLSAPTLLLLLSSLSSLSSLPLLSSSNHLSLLLLPPS